MIIKTDAIVLKSMRYRDTSKIVTFYSRRYGKIKGIAKGARDIKSKFGGALEPISLVHLVLYRKEAREIQLISQCDLIDRFQRIHSTISKMAIGLGIVELLQRTTHDEEENASLFRLVRETLQELERAERNGLNFLRAFQLRLGAVFGYGVALERCVRCERGYEAVSKTESVFFIPALGGAICPDCMLKEHLKLPSVKVSVESLHLMRQLLRDPLVSASVVEVSEQVGNEIDEALRSYVQHHFEGIRSLRSLEVLHAINPS